MDLKQARVLVTPTSYGRNDPKLRSDLESLVGEVIYNSTGKPLSSAQVTCLLPGIDGYIAGLDRIDQAALEHADRLKVIARYGVGVDCVDLQAAREKNIVVTNTPNANSASVAELALGLMLALARQIPKAVAAAHRGQFPRLSGVSLENKTIGILGLGAIGKQLALHLAGFNCHILAYDPYPDFAFAKEHAVEFAPLDNLLNRADFISLHLPLLPATRAMVDAVFLSKMKKGAYLVNTARGELVDEQALIDALKASHLRGAALDVLAQEPPDLTHPLLRLPQVIITPHIGAQTDEATNLMGWIALKDCLAVLQGIPPVHRVV